MTFSKDDRLSRRTCIKRLLQATAVLGTPRGAERVWAAVTQPTSLRKAAADRGLLYGCCDGDTPLGKTPVEFQRLFFEHCALFAPHISWKRVSPQRGILDTSRADADIKLTDAHGIRLSGSHLLWPGHNPAWFDDLTVAEMSAEIRGHVEAMVTRYAGRVWSWNVLNEMIEPRAGRPDGLVPWVFVKKLGTSFMDEAYHLARAKDPHALLVYNDFGFESDDAPSAARRKTLLSLLDGFVKRKTPVQAVGLQSHISLNGSPLISDQAYRGFLREISDRGFKILITELDVADKSTPPGIAERDRLVADAYARFLSVALDERAVLALVIWGLSDRYTYLNLPGPRFSKFQRSDGLPTRPLPFDENFKPKPAYTAILNALKHAPKR